MGSRGLGFHSVVRMDYFPNNDESDGTSTASTMDCSGVVEMLPLDPTEDGVFKANKSGCMASSTHTIELKVEDYSSFDEIASACAKECDKVIPVGDGRTGLVWLDNNEFFSLKCLLVTEGTVTCDCPGYGGIFPFSPDDCPVSNDKCSEVEYVDGISLGISDTVAPVYRIPGYYEQLGCFKNHTDYLLINSADQNNFLRHPKAQEEITVYMKEGDKGPSLIQQCRRQCWDLERAVIFGLTCLDNLNGNLYATCVGLPSFDPVDTTDNSLRVGDGNQDCAAFSGGENSWSYDINGRSNPNACDGDSTQDGFSLGGRNIMAAYKKYLGMQKPIIEERRQLQESKPESERMNFATSIKIHPDDAKLNFDDLIAPAANWEAWTRTTEELVAGFATAALLILICFPVCLRLGLGNVTATRNILAKKTRANNPNPIPWSMTVHSCPSSHQKHCRPRRVRRRRDSSASALRLARTISGLNRCIGLFVVAVLILWMWMILRLSGSVPANGNESGEGIDSGEGSSSSSIEARNRTHPGVACSRPVSIREDLTEEQRNPAVGERWMVDPPTGGNLHLVCCDTTKGSFRILLHERWAPTGVSHLLEMLGGGYFDTEIPLFRCTDACQFGLSANQTLTKAFGGTVADDPLWLPTGPEHRYFRAPGGSGEIERYPKGVLTYAGGGRNSRGNQFVLTLQPNKYMGGGSPWEVPLGEVVEIESERKNAGGESSDVSLPDLYTGYGERGPGQGLLHREGASASVRERWPLMDYVLRCSVVDQWISDGGGGKG
ncbi:unnamed protein product [Pseudo-nitzschia multistriata]|uniref:PPIase cyclophilin-type domain-containing protein n=1 Tax=Pseudo-nitzschia multistriata TaxID=183589 RepID=A0A448Z0W9_9STRA|nr:unnamed protein product [Pseudo-nitzschia multistriata]